jgi:hypothetical protein
LSAPPQVCDPEVSYCPTQINNPEDSCCKTVFCPPQVLDPKASYCPPQINNPEDSCCETVVCPPQVCDPKASYYHPQINNPEDSCCETVVCLLQNYSSLPTIPKISACDFPLYTFAERLILCICLFLSKNLHNCRLTNVDEKGPRTGTQSQKNPRIWNFYDLGWSSMFPMYYLWSSTKIQKSVQI